MTLIMPAEVHHDLSGFSAILGIASRTTDCFFDEIEIDMSRTTWFDADMCALFGSLLYKMKDALNDVRLADIHPSVRSILSKNGFLSHYGEDRVPDRWGTTIRYHRFETSDDRSFAEYIERELVHRQEIPAMSRRLTKKFRESIFEIFSNAVLHSETKLGVFSCGQFFPSKRTLNFTVADLGIGICESIRKHTGHNMSPCQAIEWATQGNNTTKKDSIPGGLGLKLLGEFIDLNRGVDLANVDRRPGGRQPAGWQVGGGVFGATFATEHRIRGRVTAYAAQSGHGRFVEGLHSVSLNPSVK